MLYLGAVEYIVAGTASAAAACCFCRRRRRFIQHDSTLFIFIQLYSTLFTNIYTDTFGECAPLQIHWRVCADWSRRTAMRQHRSTHVHNVEKSTHARQVIFVSQHTCKCRDCYVYDCRARRETEKGRWRDRYWTCRYWTSCIHAVMVILFTAAQHNNQ